MGKRPPTPAASFLRRQEPARQFDKRPQILLGSNLIGKTALRRLRCVAHEKAEYKYQPAQQTVRLDCPLSPKSGHAGKPGLQSPGPHGSIGGTTPTSLV